MKNVKGQWSGMFAKLIQLLLYGRNHDGLAAAGVPLACGPAGAAFHLKAYVSHVLADGDGWIKAYQWKGAASLRPCFRHANVLKLHSDLAHRSREGRYVETTCADHTKFKSVSDEDLFWKANLIVAARKRVDDGTMTNAKLEELQKAVGLHATEDGLLCDPVLRASSAFSVSGSFTVDWVHSALQDGMMSTEAFLMVCSLEAAGVPMADLYDFFALPFTYPKEYACKRRHLKWVWKQSQNSETKLRCSCSEMLGLYVMLRHFVEANARDDLEDEIASYKAACDCIDIIMMAKRGTLSMADAARRLRDALQKHARLHLAAYGDANCKPKHHWMWDIAEQMERDAGVAPGLLDMFVIERLHLKVKRQVRTVVNTTSMEKTVRPCFHLACGLSGYMRFIYRATRGEYKIAARELWIRQMVGGPCIYATTRRKCWLAVRARMH